MKLAAEWHLAWRYLLNHRQGAWGWVIGWLATGSVALGVAALIVTLSVMTGFREDIREKILGVQPHVIVSAFDGTLNPSDQQLIDKLNQTKEIETWSPYISGQVLIGRGSQSSGAVVKGVDPKKEPDVANLRNKLVGAAWQALEPADLPKGSKPQIFIGQELARNIGARIGDTVWMITPGSIGITALSIPQAHLFIVGGYVQSGLYDYDSSLAYINIPAAQKLFAMKEKVSGIGIRLKDPDISDAFARDFQMDSGGGYWVRSWISLNRNLFSALKLEKAVMFTILTMVTLVASVMIVSNLLLSISQKTREIGILRAIGATSETVRKIFLLQGVFMGFVGTFIGAGLGMGVSLILAKTNFIRLPADVYYIDRLPVRLDPMDIALVVFAGCLITLVATLYPAHRATRVDPLEAIRYG